MDFIECSQQHGAFGSRAVAFIMQRAHLEQRGGDVFIDPLSAG